MSEQLWLCVPRGEPIDAYLSEIGTLRLLRGPESVLVMAADGYKLSRRFTTPAECLGQCIKFYGVGYYPFTERGRRLEGIVDWDLFGMEPQTVCSLLTTLRYLYGWRAESGLAAVAELMNAPIGDTLVPITPAMLRAAMTDDETVEEAEVFATIWGTVQA